MASSAEYFEYILDLLADVSEVTTRATRGNVSGLAWLRRAMLGGRKPSPHIHLFGVACVWVTSTAPVALYNAGSAIGAQQNGTAMPDNQNEIAIVTAQAIQGGASLLSF